MSILNSSLCAFTIDSIHVCCVLPQYATPAVGARGARPPGQIGPFNMNVVMTKLEHSLAGVGFKLPNRPTDPMAAFTGNHSIHLNTSSGSKDYIHVMSLWRLLFTNLSLHDVAPQSH